MVGMTSVVNFFQHNFVQSVIASLLAATIFLLISVKISKSFRGALTALASEFLNVDVKYVFRNGREAEPAIREALEDGRTVKIFTSRGNEFQRELYRPLLDGEAERQVYLLLPAIARRPNQTDWVASREDELAVIDRSFGRGTLGRQIDGNVEFLRPYIKRDYFELQRYHAPHIGRIIITERYCFLTPYSSKKHGRDSKVYQYRRGDMYDMFDRFFDLIWSDSTENRGEA